jgi:hypothetical protein
MKRKAFFFEKKKQKTFAPALAARRAYLIELVAALQMT